MTIDIREFITIAGFIITILSFYGIVKKDLVSTESRMVHIEAELENHDERIRKNENDNKVNHENTIAIVRLAEQVASQNEDIKELRKDLKDFLFKIGKGSKQ